MKRTRSVKGITYVLIAIVIIFASVNCGQPEKVNAKSRSVAGHICFSKGMINKRLKVIKDYYYNKPEKLTIQKRKIYIGGLLNMEYYIHGKDLMFGYGTKGKTEYRLYFYKNQLIQMLVDKPGKPRKTYKQLYKRLEDGRVYLYDNNLDIYMLQECYARKEMDFLKPKTKKNISKNPVMITKVQGNSIVYHEFHCYGPDGCIWSIGTKAYKADLSKKVFIEDGSESPYKVINRNMKWLRKSLSKSSLGTVAVLSADGKKTSKMVIPYFA